ncbi:UL23 [anatid alphaherpesvirus 1]|nr:UL23 [Anatid alphaherpesvirus 1]WKE35619.1 thymidine kinase [Anatid alphaherpesvirus 1]WOC94995.1 UL23 [Anatid alphaherpesvirus 1]
MSLRDSCERLIRRAFSVPSMPLCLVRVYLDGPYGTGKTTTGKLLSEDTLAATLYVAEPMAYWRNHFEDVIKGVYETQERKARGDIATTDAKAITAALQLQFFAPYSSFHTYASTLFGVEAPERTPPDITLIIDRHPTAACLCFPAARFVVGDMSLSTLLAMISLIPREPHGGNIVIMDLNEDEHLERLRARQRPGEAIDVRFLRVLHNIYKMFVNTIWYAKQAPIMWDCDKWDKDWSSVPIFDDDRKKMLEARDSVPIVGGKKRPSPSTTLLSLFKVPELCDESFRLRKVHEWNLRCALIKVADLNAYFMDISGKSPQECAAEVREATNAMDFTRLSFTMAGDLEQAVNQYNTEMTIN